MVDEKEISEMSFENAKIPVRMGIDVGSTTVKVVALDENDKPIYSEYERHRADIRKIGRAHV